MARILGEGTGAATASVWLHVSGELRPAATWPADASAPLAVAAPVREDGPVEIPGTSGSFPVRHQGELLGALSVEMPREESFGAEQEKLCTDLAAQAGLVLRNVRLIQDLRASRQRLVAAQDEERRKIERNLHDGAQQQLVALAVKGRIATDLMDRDPAKARSMLEEIQAETTDALETLRDLAHGIYPPVLADQGLPAALQAQARKAPMPVEIDADGVGRYPPEVEAAVYFSCLEALQNVSKYAGASQVSVRLSLEEAALMFDVRDDGAGFDPALTKMGSGIQGIADRLAALGGRMDITSAPGQGTTVTGRVPLAG
jgi:signal transduction histidine kinase